MRELAHLAAGSNGVASIRAQQWRVAMARACTLLAALLPIAVTACRVTADYGGTAFQCEPGDECPPGFECRDGSCVPAGSPTDDGGTGGSDAAIDAGTGTPDAGAPDAGPVAACGTTAKLMDDFDDGVTGPQWGDGWADPGTERLEQDGQLVLRVSAGAGDAWAGTYSRHALDLTGHHARVRVDQVGPLYTVLEVAKRDGARAQVVGTEGTVRAAVYGLADGNGVRAEVPYDPVAHRWWRIREQGGVMFWELSGDGESWLLLHQEPNPFSPRLIRVVLAAGGSVAEDAEARMDEVNPDGDPGQPWCPISTARDDFDDGELSELWADSWETAGCQRQEADGVAAIAFDGTADSWCGYESFPVFDACNGYAAVEIPTPLDVDEAEMWLELYLPDGRLYLGQWSGMLRAEEREGAMTTMSSAVTYEPTAHRWWRIRTDGATTYWETSPDGADWTTQATRPISLDCSTAYVGFGAGVWNTWSAGPIDARFDNFNMLP